MRARHLTGYGSDYESRARLTHGARRIDSQCGGRDFKLMPIFPAAGGTLGYGK